MNTIKKPLVSIITVVYNAASFVEETIQSVVDQTFSDYEFIIIDGGSTDGTLEVVNKYRGKIDYFVSEPDKGIYDAMNKGIVAARGKWLNFLNAGDSLLDNEVLQRIFGQHLEDYTLIYGDIQVLKENGNTLYHKAVELKTTNDIMKGMKVCHQAIFYHKDIIHPYDTVLRLKSEWKHLIEMTRKPNFKPLKLNFAVVQYRTGGLGAQQLKLNQKELRKVFYEKFGPLNYVLYIPYFLTDAARRVVKGIIGKQK